MCNGYLPTGSVFERYMWVLRFFARNGFYVNVDFHPADRSADKLVLAEGGATFVKVRSMTRRKTWRGFQDTVSCAVAV